MLDPFGLEKHHIVVRSLWEKNRRFREEFSEEAMKVFRANTFEAPGHEGFKHGHFEYNRAVRSHVAEWLKKNQITPECMTASQARGLVQSILDSKEPRISKFLRRIFGVRLRRIRLRAYLPFLGPISSLTEAAADAKENGNSFGKQLFINEIERPIFVLPGQPNPLNPDLADPIYGWKGT